MFVFLSRLARQTLIITKDLYEFSDKSKSIHEAIGKHGTIHELLAANKQTKSARVPTLARNDIHSTEAKGLTIQDFQRSMARRRAQMV